MSRFDHTAIFVSIAGTMTPIATLGVGGGCGEKSIVNILDLCIFWNAYGALKEFFWKSAPRWSSGVLYVLMGWLAVPYLRELHAGLGSLNVWFLIGGGVIYTLGALIYAFRWPDPFPKVFGFHEIFHALTVVAGFLHFIVIFHLVTHS